MQNTLRADIRKTGKYLKNTYVGFSVDTWFKQNHIYSAFNTETTTPGYTLLNASFGTDIAVKGKTKCSLFFNINNLTDIAYQSHLSRLKYGDINYATGRSGVYNVGRNLSIKLQVPLGI
jgi:iron complex outermembrane recepter protein